MNEIYEKLTSIVESYEKDIIKDVMDSVKIPSVTDDREEVKKALRHAMDCGKKLGFESETFLDEEVGTIEFGEGEETLGILAHVDVVSEGDLEIWDTPPFEPVIRDNSLFGRGTLDDKGPVMASLYAMKAVADLAQELGQKPFKKTQMILGTREETEWSDMYAYVEKYPLPDYGFTPDGEFPICNIEKGVASLTMSLPAGFDNRVSRLKGGTASNVVPGKCEATINGADVLVNGKAVHASEPEKGENAILGMAKKILDMRLGDTPIGKVAAMLDTYFQDREGSALGLRSESEYYDGEFVHRNIFTPTIIEADKTSTKITFDIRYAYGTDFKDILKAFQKLADDLNGSIENYQDLPPVYVSSKLPFLDVFAKAYETITGLENEYVLAYGGSYAKAMPNVVSWGPIFPGDPDTCHEENEFIPLDSLMKNTKIFAIAIWDIVMTEKSFI